MLLFPLSDYRNRRVCVAVSGGIDSVCLLHAFRARAEEYGIVLSAVTCDHGIRAESKSDVLFVRDLCVQWGVPLVCYKTDVPAIAADRKMGLEEAGRLFRAACFRRILDCGLADVVATAHHADDYAETVLFRLARGTSLAGMKVFTADLVHPLLNVSREDITEYARSNGLSYVEDESNGDLSYARNAIRHSVLPALEACVEGAKRNLVQFARRAAEDDDFLQNLARESVEVNGDTFAVPVDLPKPLFMRACLIVMKSLGIVKDYTAARLEEIYAFKDAQSGKRSELQSGVTAVLEHGKLVFYRPQPLPAEELPFAVGTARLGEFETGVFESPAEAWGGFLRIDRDAVPKSCVIRVRREGDVFQPYMGGRKSLKKYLTDRKIPARIGRSLPVLAGGNEIFAVFGVEIADPIKVTRQTENVLYLQLKRIVHE